MWYMNNSCEMLKKNNFFPSNYFDQYFTCRLDFTTVEKEAFFNQVS